MHNESVPRVTHTTKRASSYDQVATKNNFLIINLCNPFSLGGAAIASTIVGLIELIPETAITAMPTRLRDVSVYTEKYDFHSVMFVPHLWFREKQTKSTTILHSIFPLFLSFISCLISSVFRRNGVCKNFFSRYNIIIDLNSDALNEYYGKIYPLFTLVNLALASMSDKPIVTSPCSIAYFKSGLLRELARLILNRVNTIMVRETISKINLIRLGVSKPRIVVSPDLAFLMEPSSLANIDEEIRKDGKKLANPVVGIVPSGIIHNYAFPREHTSLTERYTEYLSSMAAIADFVIDTFKATVVLIPHSYGETGSLSSFSDEDDRTHCERIYRLMKNKRSTIVIRGNYSANEIKGLIGRCDLFIGCRMHSIIAAMSLHVPTVVVAYGEKFDGVIGKMLGQSDQIVRIDSDHGLFLSQMKSKIVVTWDRRNEIRESLEAKMTGIKKSAAVIVSLLKEIAEKQSQRARAD